MHWQELTRKPLQPKMHPISVLVSRLGRDGHTTASATKPVGRSNDEHAIVRVTEATVTKILK